MTSDGTVTGSARSPLGPRGRLILALAVVVVVLLIAVAWVAVRTLLAKGELDQAVARAADARSAVTEGDTEAAQTAVRQLAAHAGSAAALTSDPLSLAAGSVPLLGPNLRAFGALAAAVDDTATGVLIPLLAVADGLDGDALAPSGGRIDVTAIAELAPTLTSAEERLDAVRADVAAIDTASTLDPITEAVTQLSGILDDTSATVTAASRTAQLLPVMLGSDDDRRYLLLFQNNAEVRATGGLPGALALVSTSDGAFELTDQASAGEFPRYEQPVLPLDFPTTSLYGDVTGRFMQNVGLTPDFPTSARLAQEMWRLRTGVTVDGVIAVDPVTLGYLLASTGPITLSSGDVLDSSNAVDFLLSGIYAKYPDNARQDAVFADAAREVIAALASGEADPAGMLQALGMGGAEGRILIWNARDEEQALLEDTAFSGTLPVDNAATSTIGVFFDDATGAKMDYYLDGEVEVESDNCGAEAAWTARVRLASSAPSDAATSLPAYVTGDGDFGVPAGVIRTRVIVYGPVGSVVEAVTRDGSPARAQVEQHLGRPAAQIVVDSAPGESTELEISLRGDGAAESPTSVRMTPLIDFVVPEVSPRNCG